MAAQGHGWGYLGVVATPWHTCALPKHLGILTRTLLLPSPALSSIRVHSLSVPIVTDLADLYNGADAAALACLTANQPLPCSPLHQGALPLSAHRH